MRSTLAAQPLLCFCAVCSLANDKNRVHKLAKRLIHSLQSIRPHLESWKGNEDQKVWFAHCCLLWWSAGNVTVAAWQPKVGVVRGVAPLAPTVFTCFVVLFFSSPLLSLDQQVM